MTYKSENEKNAIDFLKSSKKELIEKYKNKFNNILDTDKARELFTVVGYNGLNANDYQNSSSRLVNKVFDTYIKSATKNEKCLFVIGTPGTGKTTAVDTLTLDLKDYLFIYDGVFSKKKNLSNRIAKCLKSNIAVSLLIVYRQPTLAWVNVLKRTRITSRIVPLKYFLSIMKSYKEIINDIIKKYGNKIEIRLIENMGTINEINEISIVNTDNYDYNITEIELKQLTDNFYKEGGISAEQKKAIYE